MSNPNTNLVTLQAKAQEKALTQWFDANPWAASRGIDEAVWNTLCTSVFPGAKAESVLMAWDYCQARALDPVLKPVHIMPMSVKNAQTNRYEMRDVIMPGIGLYRIQAARSEDCAGADAPRFGETVEQTFHDGQIPVKVRFPEWAEVTVYKVVGGQRVGFTVREYWLENYATKGRDSEAPNAMWKKRPFGQLAKCAEAQALRRGWPEVGQAPTAEEMEGKYSEQDMGLAEVVTPKASGETAGDGEYIPREDSRPSYPKDKFDANFPKWQQLVAAGKKTPEDVVATVESGAVLTDEQREAILALKGAA